MSRFLLSSNKVIEQHNKVKQYADIVSYSYKTNPEVGQILKEKTGCMFSLHSTESVGELNCPERIWFFPQGWTKRGADMLLKKKITNFVVDNENDLNILLGAMEGRQEKISLLLRMRLKEHTIHTGKHFVYGMYSEQVNRLVPILRKNKGIEKLGLHFHRKTQNVSEWSLKSELHDTIIHWDKIDIVNIGGGIPIEYKNFRIDVLKSIFEEIDGLKRWLTGQGIKMIIEPGRYIAGPSVKLEADILNIYGSTIVVDCSIFNAALDTWIANIRLLIEGELDSGEAYTIKGITPDSSDILRYKVHLKKPKVGDKILFLNAGAYNFSTDFCNLPKIETVLMD